MKLGTQTTYPDFVPNQILTNSQLNDLRQHLDLQDRATRKKLVGTGIVCGFRWRLAGSPGARVVKLSEGLGVTSDGYLICLCEPALLTRARDPYKDPDLEENGTTPSYEPWRTSPTGGQRKLVELVAVAAGEQAPADTRVLKQADLEDRVLVLYLELEPVEQRSCFVTECDNKGRKVNVNLRVLAVAERFLDKEKPCPGPLKRFRVPRLHTVRPLDKVKKAADIDQGYGTIVRAQLPRLVDRIQAAFTRYRELLDLDRKHVEVLDNSFSPALTAAPVNQYRYDALKDMAAAYNEFVDAACAVVADCCPPNDFPRHLMLGAFDPAEDGYRHRFHPSAVRNVLGDDLERVRKLFLRIGAIARSVRFDNVSDVRLTPSRWEGAALGQRAIPYYLDRGSMGDLWQPKLCCTNDKLWSYHDHQGAHADRHDHEHDSSDLGSNDYNRSSLIRIEGHLGKECAKARRAIVDERHLHNAEFDVLVTNFDDPSPEMGAAAQTIRDLLGEQRKAVDGYRLLVARALANREFPQSEIAQARQKVEELEKRVRLLADEWATLRASRELHCDASHLETMFVALRAEMLCRLGGLRVELDKLRDEVGVFRGELPHGRGELAFEALSRLGRQERDLSHRWLPRRLATFNYPAFVHAYKGLLHDTTRFWLAWRSFGFPVRELMLELGRTDPWPPGGEAISAALLDITRGCFHTRFARLFFAFAKLWENDPGFFPNLARTVDGLEHLGGVRRCGTFVVVCDRQAATQQERVQADFSLSCRLPCCCETDVETLCLPPVALAGHRVERLRKRDDGGFAPVKVEISLAGAGYEPNFAPEPGAPTSPPLRVKLRPGQTALGGKVEFDEATKLAVYSHEEPRPGLIDSFDYALVSEHDECPGEDFGKFWIAMETAPEKEPDKEPEPSTNFVCGTVTFSGKPFKEVGGQVYIEEDPRHPIPIGTGPDGNPGYYESRALAFGRYHLVAAYKEYLSQQVEVEIKAGPKTRQNLDLRPKEARVRIRVVDLEGVLLAGTGVQMRNVEVESIRLESKEPTTRGVHDFKAVRPGTYVVQGTAKGYKPGSVSLVVAAGGLSEASVSLSPIIRLPGGFLVANWFEANRDVDKTRITVEKAYSNRFEEGREKTVAKAKENPGLAGSEPYKRALAFITKIAPQADLAVRELTRAYAKTSDGVVRSISQLSTPQARKAMQEVLAEVSKAYLDRVSIEQPGEMTPEVQDAVRLVRRNLERANIPAATFRATYRSAELEPVLVTARINDLIQ